MQQQNKTAKKQSPKRNLKLKISVSNKTPVSDVQASWSTNCLNK